MKQFVSLIILVILLVILGIYVSGEASEKQASAFYGRAHLVEVQNEARKDLLAGLMPYTILGLGVVSGAVIIILISLIIFALLFVWINNPTETITSVKNRRASRR